MRTARSHTDSTLKLPNVETAGVKAFTEDAGHTLNIDGEMQEMGRVVTGVFV